MNTSGKKMDNPMQHTITVLPLSQVTIPDYIAVFSYPQTGGSLIESVRRYGIINPVTVTGGENNSYFLVCGAKRMLAAKELGLEEIPANILSGRRLTAREMFDFAFADNVPMRVLNIIETAGVISFLSESLRGSADEEMKKYTSQMELQSSAQSIEIYKSIYTLEDKIKKYLLQWNISAGHAVRLTMFNRKERTDLFKIIELLQLHGGKFKQFLELIFEICKKDKKSVNEIFSDREAVTILRRDKITLRQKQAKILDWLHACRYPQLSKRVKTFSTIAASINNLHADVFSPPGNFEGDKLRASLSFKSLEELDAFCTALQDESNRNKIQYLLDLL